MKMLDPTSVVREGEYATAANSGGVPEYIRGLYNRAVEGEKLTPQQRQKMLSAAGGQLGVYRKRYDEAATNYGGLAERAGVPRENVVMPLTFPEYTPQDAMAEAMGAAPAAAPAAAVAPAAAMIPQANAAPPAAAAPIDYARILQEELGIGGIGGP